MTRMILRQCRDTHLQRGETLPRQQYRYRTPMGGAVPDVMLPTSPRLGLWAAPHKRGTGTFVAIGEECHVWTVKVGIERRTPHAAA